ncbi:MAG: sigma-70 family RNA polymerase sigma factor [Planctomycetes bacterium]|nr:sigma-70 family RNA polymerase sigma factor [Planctomycetota bacterium]
MWPAPDETQQILQQVRKGEAEAVDRLLSRHRDALRRMVEFRLDRALASRVDASDIIQETLIEANRRLADYMKNPAMPFHLWLRYIARDHLIAAQRRHQGAQRRSVNRERSLADPAFSDCSSVDLAARLRAAGPTPAAEAIRKELEHRFQEALSGLGGDDREVILMRHFEHLSNQEVAQTLGLTEQAASMRYLRALRRLRDRLGIDLHDTL